MKRILKSLFMVTALVAVVAVGTQALFSDTETSTGNTFTTGTIDIAVDGENPWTTADTISLEDMKPSQTGYLDFVVHNVGTNPVNLWKTLKNFVGSDYMTSEPECVAEDGQWVDNGQDGVCENNTPVYNLQAKIKYDMRVELYKTDPRDSEDEPVWWETIYMDQDGFTLNELGQMYLGMVPSGWYMKVIQSYHMAEDTGNKYQGDKLTFDIELYAEQLNKSVRLVRKYEANTDVSHHVWDDTYADFGYKIKDDVMRWSLTTSGVVSGDYTLMVWDDTPDYVWPWGDRDEAVVLKHLNVTGDATYTGEYDPNADVLNAKVWLVPGTWGTEGDSAGNFDWNATKTYFETGLIDFYDSLD